MAANAHGNCTQSQPALSPGPASFGLLSSRYPLIVDRYFSFVAPDTPGACPVILLDRILPPTGDRSQTITALVGDSVGAANDSAESGWDAAELARTRVIYTPSGIILLVSAPDKPNDAPIH